MDLPIQSIESLRLGGRDAAACGQCEGANPFPRGCAHHEQWADGYDWAVITMVDRCDQEGG
ncbi:hypothetical protein D8I24_6510 [Cupriavidus necator H850]|nr:hypothetical protein D8I24_6510 [Cupriavidus necator H850]